jgi:hypothetical protein
MSELPSPIETEVVKSHEQIAEKTFDFAIKTHAEFDKRKKIDKSFHNEDHVKAGGKAADLLILSAIAGQSIIDNNRQLSNSDKKLIREQYDPLNLIADLEIWNQTHPDTPPVSLSQFRSAVKIAYGLHDIGYPVESITYDKNEKPSINYNDEYTSKDHEERGANLAVEYLQNSQLSQTDKDTMIPLVKELILSTESDSKIETIKKPFNAFVQIVDQVGNFIFNEDEDRFWALYSETDKFPKARSDDEAMEIAKDNIYFSLANLIDIGRIITKKFYSSPENLRFIKSIFKIWGVNPTPTIEDQNTRVKNLAERIFSHTMAQNQLDSLISDSQPQPA